MGLYLIAKPPRPAQFECGHPCESRPNRFRKTASGRTPIVKKCPATHCNSGRRGCNLYVTTMTMKHIWMVAVLSHLGAGLSKASDVIETNAMPAHFRNLMETQGYTLKQSAFGLPTHNTNSQRNISWTERIQFTPFIISKKKAGWNLWNNSSFKRAGRTEAPINLISRPLTGYEYDITYSFGF